MSETAAIRGAEIDCAAVFLGYFLFDATKRSTQGVGQSPTSMSEETIKTEAAV